MDIGKLIYRLLKNPQNKIIKTTQTIVKCTYKLSKKT